MELVSVWAPRQKPAAKGFRDQVQDMITCRYFEASI